VGWCRDDERARSEPGGVVAPGLSEEMLLNG
jgi:hypothetical protein